MHNVATSTPSPIQPASNDHFYTSDFVAQPTSEHNQIRAPLQRLFSFNRTFLVHFFWKVEFCSSTRREKRVDIRHDYPTLACITSILPLSVDCSPRKPLVMVDCTLISTFLLKWSILLFKRSILWNYRFYSKWSIVLQCLVDSTLNGRFYFKCSVLCLLETADSRINGRFYSLWLILL